jgi:hypothetical protein
LILIINEKSGSCFKLGTGRLSGMLRTLQGSGVLVCLGSYKIVHKLMAYEQQTLISHSSGGWKAKAKAGGSGAGSCLTDGSSHSVVGGAHWLSEVFLKRALIPKRKAEPS